MTHNNWHQKDIDYILSLCTKKGKQQARFYIEKGLSYPIVYDRLQRDKCLLHLPCPNSPLFPNPSNGQDGDTNNIQPQIMSKEEEKKRKRMKCDEVRGVLRGYDEDGSLYFKQQWEFTSDYNIRYGFLKLAILFGSIIKFIKSTKKVRRIFRESPKQLIEKLESIQIENARLWYLHSADVDLHGMNGKTAAKSIEDFICQDSSWTVIRFVFGQDRHGGNHPSFGTLKKLGALVFDVELQPDIPDDYKDSIMRTRNIVHSTPSSFEIQFYADRAAVQVKRIKPNDTSGVTVNGSHS